MGFPLAAEDDDVIDVCECNLPCPELIALGGGSGIGPKGPVMGIKFGGAGIELPGGGGGGGPKIKITLINVAQQCELNLTWNF